MRCQLIAQLQRDVMNTRFFLIKTSKFWPSLVVLKFLHDLSLIVLSLFLIFVEIILP